MLLLLFITLSLCQTKSFCGGTASKVTDFLYICVATSNYFLQGPLKQGLLVFESESVGQSGLQHGSTAVVLKQLKGQEQTVGEPGALLL